MAPKVMRVVYSIFQFLALILAGPLLLVKAALTPKYRGRIGGRLGFVRGDNGGVPAGGSSRIWIHALSLGEVASAQVLVAALRRDMPDAFLIFSATTAAGEDFARRNLAASVDLFVPFPLDIPFSINRLLDRVRPDLFILVETDFWPNFLYALRHRAIPAFLVNGRISDNSWKWYCRGRLLFGPLFCSFARLAMQTARDAARMIRLGVPAERVLALGNLKFDTSQPDRDGAAAFTLAELGLAADSRVWVAGSTHDGEEEALFVVMQELLPSYPTLCLVLAPRHVARGEALEILAKKHNLSVMRRSNQRPGSARVLILDTLGELARVYGLAEIAFVGGSLVEARGHNPLEPAALGKPVLFGPHMEDFAEVSEALLQAGGAKLAANGDELRLAMEQWLADPSAATTAGQQARSLVEANRGGTQRHLAVIKELLDGGIGNGPVA